MKALFQAIMTKFTATPHNTAYTAITGGLHLGAARQGAVMPYCVFFLVSGVPEDTMSEKLENCLIQFSLFDGSQSAGNICDAYEALTDLFDDCQLTVTGYTHLFMHRESQQLVRDPEDPGVWQYIVEYRVLIEKDED